MGDKHQGWREIIVAVLFDIGQFVHCCYVNMESDVVMVLRFWLRYLDSVPGLSIWSIHIMSSSRWLSGKMIFPLLLHYLTSSWAFSVVWTMNPTFAYICDVTLRCECCLISYICKWCLRVPKSLGHHLILLITYAWKVLWFFLCNLLMVIF